MSNLSTKPQSWNGGSTRAASQNGDMQKFDLEAQTNRDSQVSSIGQRPERPQSPSMETSSTPLLDSTRLAPDQSGGQSGRTTPAPDDGFPPDLDPAAARLAGEKGYLSAEQFYVLLGMNPPYRDSGDAKTNAANPQQPSTKAGKPPKNNSKRTPQHGFYTHVQNRANRVHHKYVAYDIIVNGLLIVQIILSAVFIVLGSINSIHRITITVLGALSTLVVSILAMLKGQGLPNRLRMERDSFRMVVFEAEELYWDVAAGKSVTYADVKKLREAYLRAVGDAAKNHPDSYNVSSAAGARAVGPAAKVTASAPLLPEGGRA